MKTYTYTVRFERFNEKGEEGYLVVVPALPGIVTWGWNLEEAHEMARDAIKCHIEGLLKDREPPPPDIGGEDGVFVERLPVAV